MAKIKPDKVIRYINEIEPDMSDGNLLYILYNVLSESVWNAMITEVIAKIKTKLPGIIQKLKDSRDAMNVEIGNLESKL